MSDVSRRKTPEMAALDVSDTLTAAMLGDHMVADRMWRCECGYLENRLMGYCGKCKAPNPNPLPEPEDDMTDSRMFRLNEEAELRVFECPGEGRSKMVDL